MNVSDPSQISHFYEQMLMQRNLVVQQQLRLQNGPLQLQILDKSSSSASSTSSLLSISCKSQQASPNNSLVSDKSESPSSSHYMLNTFPYSLLATMASSTPLPNQTKSASPHHPARSKPAGPHHYHHSSQNIYRPNGRSQEAKPTHSYIGLIALAILSAPDKKLVLSDIYQWILDNYSYFHSRGSGWRNSIRHNLSLNDCFMKSGRSSNGKGHYWTIHPANMDDFVRGDFRRRRAQRRVRKSLGLTVPEEDEEDDDLWTPPSCLSPAPKSKSSCDMEAKKRSSGRQQDAASDVESVGEGQCAPADMVSFCGEEKKAKKRSFNMDSLLAPDVHWDHKKVKCEHGQSGAWQLVNGESKCEQFTTSSKAECHNEDVQQWKLTFSKIMARSYKNNAASTQQTNHLINALGK
ncbi:forkhead domain-containing, partial [Brachionus plicatilis]